MNAAAASEHERLQDGVVALEDRVDHQRPETRAREDVLDDDGAADQLADDDSRGRERRDRRIREQVPDDDLVPLQTLARRASGCRTPSRPRPATPAAPA